MDTVVRFERRIHQRIRERLPLRLRHLPAIRQRGGAFVDVDAEFQRRVAVELRSAQPSGEVLQPRRRVLNPHFPPGGLEEQTLEIGFVLGPLPVHQPITLVALIEWREVHRENRIRQQCSRLLRHAQDEIRILQHTVDLVNHHGPIDQRPVRHEDLFEVRQIRALLIIERDDGVESSGLDLRQSSREHTHIRIDVRVVVGVGPAADEHLTEGVATRNRLPRYTDPARRH